MTKKSPDHLSRVGLDTKDRAILYELDCNARQSNSAIAKKVGLDKNVVNYRINKLLESKIIDGFYTIIDMTRIGSQGFRAYLKWGYLPEGIENEIVNYAINSPLVWWAGVTEGTYNFTILFWAKNNYEFRDFWFDFMRKYQQYIERKLVSIYTGLYHYSFAFLSPKKIEEPPMQYIGSSESIEISETERKILSIIAHNARLSTVEIAKKAGVAPATVKYIIKKLQEKGVIKGFRVLFNFDKLGYTYYKVFFHLRNQSKYKQLLAFARAHPNIIYVDEAIGASEFEPNILAENHKQFKEITKKLSEIAGNSLKERDYFIYSYIAKIKYF